MQFENVRPKSGVSPSTNQRPRNQLFWRFCNLTANLTTYVFGTKHDVHNLANALVTRRGLLHRLKRNNRARALKRTRGPLHRLKISWNLVHKRLKIRPEFLPTLHKICVLLRCQALHAEVSKRSPTKREVNGADTSRINWRRTATINETIEIASSASPSPKKHFKLAMASRWAALSGNTLFIATFSSWWRDFYPIVSEHSKAHVLQT